MASSWVGLIVFVAAAAAILQCTGAATHIVGDSTGWQVPSTGVTFYENWAKSQTFAVGDVLSFVFDTSRHDVANVTKANFDACTTTATVHKTSPYNFTLTAGEHYFFCTVGAHCTSGQKLSITVGSTPAGSPGSSPTPSSSATPPPPPPPSSASSLGAGFGGFVAVLTAFFL